MSKSSSAPGGVPALVLAASLLALAGSAIAQESPASADSGKGGGRGNAPLFASDSTIAFTLAFDRKAVFKQRDTMKIKPLPATLTWTDPAGGSHEIPISISTRGHFRLSTRACQFPPLRLTFDKETTKGTPFERQKSLKLVTHCNDAEEYQENVYKEYLTYRVYNLMTQKSFRARLAKVTYVDTAAPESPSTKVGILLESEAGMADRNNAKLIEAKGGSYDDVDPALMQLVAVFEYLIANTDWSLPYLHNIRLIQSEDGFVYTVPYDFDWSGIVGASYAKPDPSLPIKNTRQRLYRGPCLPPSAMTETFAAYNAKKPDILALYTSQPGLSDGYVKLTTAYIEEFYQAINDPTRWKREIEYACSKQ